MKNLDLSDIRILKELQKDASSSIEEISELVSLSRNACWRRIRRLEEDGILKNIECFEDNPVARGLTNTLRYELFDLFEDIGGVHMQIGKSYNFRKGLNIESWNVIENIKHIVDPNGLINPGSLGLNLGDDHN